MTEPVKIDLKDYIPAGEGSNGESYNHREDPSVMLKLYFPGKVEQPLKEMELARKVYDLGIPTPEPGDYVVTPDGRYGIRFRRIMDKVSYARAVGDNPEEVERYATEFAALCLALHSVQLDRTQFSNVKDNYYKLLAENPFFTLREKSLLEKFIADVPEKDTAIHGDLQFGNAIFAGDKRYFIDLGDFCYGNPLFDLGMVYLTGNLNLESFTKEAFHMDNATARRFWEAFAPAYFGSGRPLSSIEEEVRPFAGLKTIIIERDTRRPMPEFRSALESILK
ncbi:MAG: phosphotransferase [Bacteroidales bacterium]|nr:phosphotransferase [Bacteroidales bacterium]